MRRKQHKRWGTRLGTVLALLAPFSALTAPVSGSSDKVLPSRPTTRAQAVAPESTADFCDSVYLKTGRLLYFSLLRASTASSQTALLGSDKAGAVSFADIESYVTYSDTLESASAHTGSLRWSLWAVPQNHVAGWPKMNGYRLGGFVPSLIDSQGKSQDYLYNLTEITLRQRIATVNPPAGRYCLAVVMDMYSTSNECRSSDGYCPEAVYTMTPANTFR
ncbi:hypothetical protein [Sphaerotilus sp.]|uniref:hypothetical protein n=1 Tax=Sphaerotilus sp. TaxID=2093942 RepID=UPI0034E2E75A